MRFPESLYKSAPPIDPARRTIVCGPKALRVQDARPTLRTIFNEHSIKLLGWPSRRGVIVLDNASAADFDFLGLKTTNPPLLRDPNQESEDLFCQKLLLLGAQWCDSLSRYDFLSNLSAYDQRAISDLEEKRLSEPTPRERRWVRVGWLNNPSTGFLMLDFERDMYAYGDSEDLVPDDVAQLMLARTMREKCEIMRKMGAREH